MSIFMNVSNVNVTTQLALYLNVSAGAVVGCGYHHILNKI